SRASATTSTSTAISCSPATRGPASSSATAFRSRPMPRASASPPPDGAVARLLASREPAVRYLALTEVLGESPQSRAVREARRAIPESGLVRALLADYGGHPYAKWRGAFWRLVSLAELGVPPR